MMNTAGKTAKAARPVLITGTSTGIGYHPANDLASQGHVVFAAVRNDGDFDRLGAIENVIPVNMGASKPRQIRHCL